MDFDKSFYQGPGKSKLLYSKEHNFAYCPVAKVSSSFWALNMVRLDPELSVDAFGDGFDMEPSIAQIIKVHEMVNKKLGIPLAKAKNISSLLSFVVVRHPFERLASAYFQKIIDEGHAVCIFK